MKIKTVTLELGAVQNLGDYTNIRPLVRLEAELETTDNLFDVLLRLEQAATETIHDIIDNELEFSGQPVKYSEEKLYGVWVSELRRCAVICPVDLELPTESNWKDTDRWINKSGDFPRKMRLETAKRVVQRFIDDGYASAFFQFPTLFDASSLPPLPDPGPEPTWSKKGLLEPFGMLRIHDMEVIEELAELDHVTKEYLRHLYDTDAENNNSYDDLEYLIRADGDWPPKEEGRHDPEAEIPF